MGIPKITALLEKLWAVRKNAVIRNMMLVGGISVLIKIIAFYKETIVASVYGLSAFLDTFYLAILIPGFIQNVFIGALKNLFVPNYINELNTTKQKGNFQTFTLLSITFIIILFIAIGLIFSIFFLEYLFPGHSEAYYRLIRIQSYYILPCLIFWGYSGYLSGLLEINNNYFAPSFSQVFLPVTTILFLWFLKNNIGDLTLAISTLVGSVLGFLYLCAIAYRRQVLSFGAFRLNDNMREMLRQYAPKATSGLLTGINPFVDQFFAAQLIAGSIAAINYGIKIPSFTIGILMLMIGNVLLPHFSRLINENREKAYGQLFKILKTVFFGTLVISGSIIVLSDGLIELLFERKEFTQEDTLIVSKIQQIAFVYVPFFLCTLICVNFLTAINKNRFMAWVSFWNLLANLVLNIVLVKIMGVYGLILSTTIVYVIASFIYVGYTHKQFKKYLNHKK